MWGMKQILTLLSLLVLAVGCNGITHNAAVETGAGAGGANPVTSQTYSNVGTQYQGFKFYSDGKFEYFASTTTNGVMTGWFLAEGIYTMDGTTLTVDTEITEQHNSGQACGTQLDLALPYTETADTIDVGMPMVLESVSGEARPDISAFPNEC